MNCLRRKVIVLSMGVVCISVVLVAALALWQPILERWYIAELGSTNEETRKAAATRLAELGSLRATPHLMRLVSEEEAKSSTEIPHIMVSGPPIRRQNTIRQHQKSHREQEWKKNWPGNALVKIGPRAIPRMIQELDPQQPSMTPWMKESFVRMGEGALPEFFHAMGSRQWHVRSQIALVLGDFEPVSQDVIEVLRKALHDESDSVRVSAMFAVARIGPEASETVPDLLSIIREDRKFVLGPAVTRFHPYIEYLGVWVETGSREVWLRQIAVQTLGQIGPNATDAIPVLIELLEEVDVQVSARGALRLIQRQ